LQEKEDTDESGEKVPSAEMIALCQQCLEKCEVNERKDKVTKAEKTPAGVGGVNHLVPEAGSLMQLANKSTTEEKVPEAEIPEAERKAASEKEIFERLGAKKRVVIVAQIAWAYALKEPEGPELVKEVAQQLKQLTCASDIAYITGGKPAVQETFAETYGVPFAEYSVFNVVVGESSGFDQGFSTDLAQKLTSEDQLHAVFSQRYKEHLSGKVSATFPWSALVAAVRRSSLKGRKLITSRKIMKIILTPPNGKQSQTQPKPTKKRQ